MGRVVKNSTVNSSGYGITLSATSDSFRPNVAGTPGTSVLKYSTTSNSLEFYDHYANVWQTISSIKSGASLINRESFTGDGTETSFGPLVQDYNPGTLWTGNILVHVGTVYQIPGTNYSFSSNGGGTDITFVSPPSDGSEITIIHGLNSTTSV